MLPDNKFKSLSALLKSFSKEELIWVNDYVEELVSSEEKKEPTLASKQVQAKKITIAYGTETGNSKKLAIDFAGKAKKAGVTVKLVGLDQYRLADLSREEYFVTVISTQGEGEPPEAAKKFYDHIHMNGFTLPRLKFAVLALGDSSYPMFCKTGEDVDSQLEKLGASRFANLKMCDLDYEAPAEEWFTELMQSLTASIPFTDIEKSDQTLELKKPEGKKIIKGTILSTINLNAKGSDKKTYHIEIAAEEVEYIAGDSIAIVPQNSRLAVKEIFAITKADPAKIITWRKDTASLDELFSSKINICYLMDKAILQYATILGKQIPLKRLDLVDLLRSYPLNAAQLEELLLSLNPIAPRIYNIASSPATHPGEIHITVLQDSFGAYNNKQYGLCTQFLEDKKVGDEIQFFIQTNKRFRLPENDKDIIMIGQGTGIAPFRSFIAERDALGAKGRNWLFFAEKRFTTDFLYQTEWQNWFATDVLTKVSLAFTNDADEPFLVHHKLQQKAGEFFEWIQAGAYLYLCGEKDPMSKEVEKTLLAIFEEQGKLSKDEALEYFEGIKKEGRYVKDVY